ncbi:hypothetical protein A7982_13789 [Minicystis rosea]|nr:hypothetical protein A7982_13789 [Minicystis rosea]
MLATTAKSYRAFMDAMDEDLVEFEDHWRPFPELLPFFRQESTLNELEIAWLAGLLAEDPPRETMEAGLTPDAPWVAKHLPLPTMTPAQARLIGELGYVWCSAFPRPHWDRLASLSDEALEALAARWENDWLTQPGIRVFAGSRDIERRPAWRDELTRLRAFFQEVASFDDDGDDSRRGPVVLVVRNVT